MHSTPIDRLLANLGGDKLIAVERDWTAADARARPAKDGANAIRKITGRGAAQIS